MPHKLSIVAGLCLAGVVAVITLHYRRDIGVARSRVSSGSLIAKTKCGPIEYAEGGQGRPVLIVHGAGGGFDQGMALGESLARQGLRVIAMSRFGYLRTPIPADASAAAQADAHVCLLDALGIEQAGVIGFSAGAPSAMQLAIRHPERVTALVLVVPATYVPRPGNAPSVTSPRATQFLFSTALKSDFLFWAARHVSPNTLVRGLLATPSEDLEKVSLAERARVNRMLDAILPVSPRRLGLLNDASITTSLPRYELERISAPTLCVSVADDKFGTYAGARYAARNIPNARFVGYPTGGHILAGHQEDLVREITSFLRLEAAPLKLVPATVAAAMRVVPN